LEAKAAAALEWNIGSDVEVILPRNRKNGKRTKAIVVDHSFFSIDVILEKSQSQYDQLRYSISFDEIFHPGEFT